MLTVRLSRMLSTESRLVPGGKTRWASPANCGSRNAAAIYIRRLQGSWNPEKGRQITVLMVQN